MLGLLVPDAVYADSRWSGVESNAEPGPPGILFKFDVGVYFFGVPIFFLRVASSMCPRVIWE